MESKAAAFFRRIIALQPETKREKKLEKKKAPTNQQKARIKVGKKS